MGYNNLSLNRPLSFADISVDNDNIQTHVCNKAYTSSVRMVLCVYFVSLRVLHLRLFAFRPPGYSDNKPFPPQFAVK